MVLSFHLEVSPEILPLREPFTIAHGRRDSARVVVARLRLAASAGTGGACGWGECVPYQRYGEDVEGVQAALEEIAGRLAGSDWAQDAGQGGDRVWPLQGLAPGENDSLSALLALHRVLSALLPAGAARNALDGALWDLTAQMTGQPVWRLLGQQEAPRACVSAYTLSIASPAALGARAAQEQNRPLLKLKLAGDALDRERIAAVRHAAPAARLIVDANESWTLDQYDRLAPEMAALGVSLLEQPLPADQDEGLRSRPRPVPLCADESCHDRASLPRLGGLYDAVNIKLDKAGGLSEALALRAAAQAQGFKIMVGCMLASSLAMAPALLLAQAADWVDLDGPLLLAQDRPGGLLFQGSDLTLPATGFLWGKL